MGVEKVGETYRCNICGNEVIVTKAGGGTLVCCDQEMKKVGERSQSTVNLPDVGG